MISNFFFFSSRRRHTRFDCDWSSDVCSSDLELKTEGVGREALLDKLTGEGRLQLKKIEFRGWDVPASFAAGAPHVGVSRWTDGEGVFHVSARSVEVNHLQLRAPQEEISLKGSVS